MIICLLLIQLLMCLIILRKEIFQLRFRNFASSVFFLVYTIVYVVEPLVLHIFFGGAKSIVGGMPSDLSDKYIYYIFNCYGISLLLTSMIFSQVKFIKYGSSAPSLVCSNKKENNHGNYIAIFIIIGFGLFIYATGMNFFDLFSAQRFAWFSESTFSLFWITVSSYFIALASIYVYYVKLEENNSRLLLVLCMASIILLGMITKDRKWVIFLASGLLASYYEVSGRTFVIKKRVVMFLLLVFFVLLISQFIRDVLFRYFIGEDIIFYDEISRWPSFLIEYGDISYFYRASIETIHQNLNNDLIVPLALFRRIIFFFLPVSYSGGLKVEDISAIFSDVVGGGDALRRGNMPPGLFGLFVISFGWFASLFIIPLIAILLKKLDSIFRYGQGNFRNVVLSLYIFSVILGFRGDDSSAFYYVFSTLLFVGVVSILETLRLAKYHPNDGAT